MPSAPEPVAAPDAPAPPAQRAPHAERPAPTGLRAIGGLLGGTVVKFFETGCAEMAAAISFYTFFSLPALITLLLTFVGHVMDPAIVQQAIITQVGGLIGNAGAEQVRMIVEHAHRASSISVATLLTMLVLALGATAAFAQLQSSLNKVWGVKPNPNRNQLRVFLVKRVFSFGVVVTVAFLLLVSLVLSTSLGILRDRFTSPLGAPTYLLEFGTSVVAFMLVTILFAVMFRFLPDARIAWRDVRAGAVCSALLYTLGKIVIGLYLGGTDPGSAYGAAGSLAVVLIWVYYTAMVLLLGATFTEQWAERYGRGVRPEAGAVAYVEEERHERTG